MCWETVIGLETHVELATRTKIFCGCTTQFGGPPNTHCCPVCTGMPGTLPVFNGGALELAVRAAVALDCAIAPEVRFDRKNYFYPDLPKAYQISQLYQPLGRNGRLTIPDGTGGEKTIRIHELHLEEDAGKLIHDGAGGATRIDFNRCGVPLIEIVTEPDFRSGAEVAAYLEQLRTLLRWLGVSDGKMQEGSLRCDVNLSVRRPGEKLGVRTEMKNLSSFRAVVRAVDHEARRQRELLEAGGRVIQETRRWDEDREISCSMRTKEEARDYRYFPEPDLPPIPVPAGLVDRCRAEQPELPRDKQKRYQREWGLPAADAELLTAERALARFFESAAALGAPPREAANWTLGQVLRLLRVHGLEVDGMPLSPGTLARLIALVAEGKINRHSAVEVLEGVFLTDGDVDAYVKEHGLEQLSDAGLVEAAVEKVLAANPKSVADFRGGKEKAFGFLVGQTMRELKGRGDPAEVNRLLRETLSPGAE